MLSSRNVLLSFMICHKFVKARQQICDFHLIIRIRTSTSSGLAAGKQTLRNMAGKPKLYYFNGRGRMESIRWLLAAAGVEFEEQLIETKEYLEKLKHGGDLLFQQVPMVEMDGMKMVQSRAILNYIAAKYNLSGKDVKQRAWIDMYCEGAMDLNELIMMLPFKPADSKEKEFANIIEKATTRYFPVFEKVLKDHGQNYLVGNQLSRADIQLLETILMAEELKADILSKFPLLKAFKERISNIPTVKKFLQPGSPRKPPTDEKTVEKTRKIFA
ncbi:glutathione S-transferase-like [Podarcis lilfordi]|uniref:glutathione transferase n=2 Tax=Podarcis lilfordi TaxID=74358 RepID=A0AA35NZG1_9SAUR|nr:glutathione S-transferase-like [Podarcis lilfordi]